MVSAVSFQSLLPCNMTSLELALLPIKSRVEPCIAWDIGSKKNESDALITVVQVTPPTCSNHRDGAPTAVLRLNAENYNHGTAIGYNQNKFFQIRFISVISGTIDDDKSDRKNLHTQLLRSMLETHKPQYILGTCSDVADQERAVALEYQTILIAQVGMPSFYSMNNPYVFGFHVSSDLYGFSSLSAVRFYASAKIDTGLAEQPVRILYRSDPDFYRSTCEAIFDLALSFGFTDTKSWSFNPYDNNHTDINSTDKEFWHFYADSICPPGSNGQYTPAIFACTNGEESSLIQRWQQNGCHPVSLFMTAATTPWASSNLGMVPYIQGASQWHPAFTYSDDFFENGAQFLEYQNITLGYQGTSDMLVSYSIITLIAKHIQWYYRAEDNPITDNFFQSEEDYENLRRSLMVLQADTLFGPFSLPDDSMQSNGRDPASTQWVYVEEIFKKSIVNKCTAPISEAEISVIIPSPTSQSCEPGASTVTMGKNQSFLSSKCKPCEVNTYSPTLGSPCIPCPNRSLTQGKLGSTKCNSTNDNILPRSLLTMGFMFVCITWSLGISMLSWIVRHKDDEIVKTSRNYLFVMTGGAMLSSLSLMAISFEAGTDSNSNVATIGCQVSPFLYNIGWVLQLGSVAGLAHPVSRHAWHFHVYSYVEPKSPWPLYAALFIDLLLCTLWTALSPLKYSRWVLQELIDQDTGMITVVTTGYCTASGSISDWVFVGPIAVCHAALLIRIIWLYVTNREKEDRFGQRRLCLYASLYSIQILIVGCPLVLAMKDNTNARYAATCWLVFLSNLGIISLLFFPIRNRRKTSEEYTSTIQLSKQERAKRKKKREEEARKAEGRRRKLNAFLDSKSSEGFVSLNLSELELSRSRVSSESQCVQAKSIEQFDVVEAKLDFVE
jgi:hypothetical protein